MGGFFAPFVPQGVSRSFISFSGIFKTEDNLEITDWPLSSKDSRILVLTLITTVDLLATTGLPT